MPSNTSTARTPSESYHGRWVTSTSGSSSTLPRSSSLDGRSGMPPGRWIRHMLSACVRVAAGGAQIGRRAILGTGVRLAAGGAGRATPEHNNEAKIAQRLFVTKSVSAAAPDSAPDEPKSGVQT
eukprot:4223219-Prymnesium_polylepis.2